MSGGFGGFLYLILGFALLAWALCWLLFPILMIKKANEIIELLKKIAGEEKKVASDWRSAVAAQPAKLEKVIAPGPQIFHCDAGDGTVAGPFTLAQLQAKKVSGETLVFSEESREWASFDSLREQERPG